MESQVNLFTHKDFQESVDHVKEAMKKISLILSEFAEMQQEFYWKHQELVFDFEKLREICRNISLPKINFNSLDFQQNSFKSLEQYIQQLPQREKCLQEFIQQVNQVPVQRIIDTVSIELHSQQIETTTITKFIVQLRSSIIQTIKRNLVELEEKVLDDLIEEEITNMQLKQFTNNPTLQVFQPKKYPIYLSMLNKTVWAYRLEWQNTEALSNNILVLGTKFLNKVIKKLQSLKEHHQIISLQTTYLQELEVTEYPQQIFRTTKDFQVFQNYVAKATKKDDIAFIFRQMSEIEKVKGIICSEADFRHWFNSKFNKNELLELNNPMKTYHCIGNKELKSTRYECVKQVV